MLFHLLANAIKFNKTRNGSIKIIINYDKYNRILKYIIEDSGIGMSKERIQNSLNLFGNINSII